MSFRVNTTSKVEFACYTVAKTLRLVFFFVFVFALFRNTNTLVGYNRGEVLLFCAFMNTVDIAFQLFCRGLTLIPAMVRRGEYDILLTKPVSPFFLSCFKMFDFLDFVTVLPAAILVGIAIQELPYALQAPNILLAVIAWVCSFFLAMGLNVIIASLAFWVTEIENGIWIYRDLVYIGRFPPEVYPKGIRQFFTFGIPILLLVATPTKILIGRADTFTIGILFLMTAIVLALSALIWKMALRRYASASA